MDTTREQLVNFINEIPESDLPQLLEMAQYLKGNQGKNIKDLILKNEKESVVFESDADDEIYLYV